ncbi:MAG TPA: EAL domain-containing protein [Solirubrobacteraceae bacterium]
MTTATATATERGNPALEALVDAAAGILSADSLEGTLGRIAHHLRALVHHDDLTVYEVDGEAGVLRPVFAAGDWVDEVLASTVPLGTGVTGWVVGNRSTRNVPNTRLEPLASIVVGTEDAAEAMVSVPLQVGERVVGALNVFRPSAQPFDREEVELVERFATMAALAYDSARQRETLRRQVRTDGLTGLLNHRACHERLSEELAAGRPVGAVLIDLDHFKSINDAHGHAEGDRVLAAAATKLRSVVRQGDAVGRLGGEEFLLILPGVDADGATDAAERARAAVAEVTLRGSALASSAGVAVAPQDATDAAMLLDHADAALYWAKRSGRGQTRRYSRGELRPRPQEAERAEIEALLARGTDAVRIVLQPVVELATGRAGGWEALARFDAEPVRGPDEWFAQAHKTGLGPELEALALRAALAAPGRPAGTFLSLNISPRALTSAPVRAALPEDLDGLVIELTEHESFGNEGQLEAELEALRARGARVALDDAGAGYAGLQQLIRVNPEILKLDRALVHGAHADASRQALLEALISFAASTGAAVCGEGVEDFADLRLLAELDVNYGQGYALARPGPGWVAPAADVSSAVAAQTHAGLRVTGARAGGGGFARGLAELADRLAEAVSIADLSGANHRAAEVLRADEVALMRVNHASGDLELLSDHDAFAAGTSWRLADFPATVHVLNTRTPGQVVAGDVAGDPAELAALEEEGLAAMLMVPVVAGGRDIALLEVYRRHPQAFTAAEVDHARVVAQQFGAALDRLGL